MRTGNVTESLITSPVGTKGTPRFFLLRFRVKFSAEMTRIFLQLTDIENCKLRYLSGKSTILQHPLKTIEMSRFH